MGVNGAYRAKSHHKHGLDELTTAQAVKLGPKQIGIYSDAAIGNAVNGFAFSEDHWNDGAQLDYILLTVKPSCWGESRRLNNGLAINCSTLNAWRRPLPRTREEECSREAQRHTNDKIPEDRS